MTPARLTCMDAKLYNAAFEGNINAFQEGVGPIKQLLTPNKNTVLHIHFTAETGQVKEDFVKNIINLCPSIVLQANAKSETPLHIAARYGHFAAVNILMEHSRTIREDLEGGVAADKKLLRATSIVGDSALHEAVRYNHFEVVKLLIREDAEYPYFANADGETPLYIAAERGYRNIASEILNHCKSPAYAGPHGHDRTALHAAVIPRDDQGPYDREAVHAAMIRGDEGTHGRTALHAAVIRHDEEMVKGLLAKEQLESSIREPDELGCLPLHLAAQYGNSEVTKLLLEKDRMTAYMRDKEGRTALHLAASRMYNSDIMEVILSYCPDCAEIVDNNGQNALHYAVENLEVFSSTARLILKKASLSNLYNEKDVDGSTPLHHMVSSKYGYVPQLIQHQRVDKLAFDKQNRTALDIADDIKVRDDRGPEGQWIKKQAAKKKDDDDSKKDSRNITKNDEDEDPMNRKNDLPLVAATLIATVTFAVGFTLLGGTIQEDEHQGTPILKPNVAFQAFVGLIRKVNIKNFLLVAFLMTMVAMASMMIAFVTATFAVLGVSSGLDIAIILTGLSFFVPTFFSFKNASDEINRREELPL